MFSAGAATRRTECDACAKLLDSGVFQAGKNPD
jgi:hypothetical protein